MSAIHDRNIRILEVLETRAFAGFTPIAENVEKAALTTGMTTDRKIFDFLLCHGIMAEIEYPGVAQLVGHHIWDVEAARLSRATRTKAAGFKCENWRLCHFKHLTH